MKKLLLICMLAAVLALGVSGAWANGLTYTPYYEVEEYYSSASGPISTPNWSLMIAGSGDYNFVITGAIVNSASGWQLDVYTGWGANPAPSGSGATNVGLGPRFTEYSAQAADLTITSTTGQVLMVRLYNNDPSFAYGTPYNAAVYNNPSSIVTSNNLFGTNTTYGPLGYGGKWNQLSPQDVPVWTNDTTSAGTTSVTWTQVSKPFTVNGVSYTPDGNVNEIAINLSDLQGIGGFDLADQFSFLYVSATCANSVLYGTVPTGSIPLPPSALLLGSGLLGLVGLGWRKGRAG